MPNCVDRLSRDITYWFIYSNIVR